MTIDFAADANQPILEEIITRQVAFDYEAIMGFLPNPDPILKAKGEDISTYESLLVDSHVGAEVEKLTDGVKAREWDVDRGRAKSKYAKVIRQWLESFDVHSFVEGVVRARLFGYQPMEVMWGLDDGLMMPVSCVAKPQKWFAFSEAGTLIFRDKEHQDGIDLSQYQRKFLVPRFNATYANPYGVGVLAKCFWPVTFKKGGWKLWLTFADKFGMPHIVGKVPASTTNEDRQKLLSALVALARDAVAVINDTDRVDVMDQSSRSASSDLYDRIVQRSNEEISKAITSQTLTSAVGDIGSYAASKTHGEVLGTAISSVCNAVLHEMNTLVGWICELNFGIDAKAPSVVLYEQDVIDKDRAERDKILTESGVRFSRSYWLRTYKLEEDDLMEEVPSSSAGPANVLPGDQALPLSFADNRLDEEPEDQLVIDALLAGITDEQLQRQMDALIRPVLTRLRGSANFGEAMDSLTQIYPTMDVDEITDTLGRMMMLSQATGRIVADRNGNSAGNGE